MDGGIYVKSYGKETLSEKSFNNLLHISLSNILLSSDSFRSNTGLYNLKNELL